MQQGDDHKCGRCGKDWMWSGHGKFSLPFPGVRTRHWCKPCCDTDKAERAVLEAAEALEQVWTGDRVGLTAAIALVAEAVQATRAPVPLDRVAAESEEG